MADSKCKNVQAETVQDLIHCGICHAFVDKPKMLPCLHSFCLHCLSSWAECAAEKDPEKYKNKISCPSCKEEYDLPTGGVKFLETNFFVLKLTEMKAIQRKWDTNVAILCTACEVTGNPAVSHCVECHDFVCKKCVDAHKLLRVTRDHQLLSLEEFCTDNRPMFNHPEQEKCLKHKGEALLLFCEKCEVPICRNCAVVDHHIDHKHVDLHKAVGRCTEELNKLATACQNVSDTLDLPIETDKKTLADLQSAVVKAEDEILKASDRIKTACLRNLHIVEAKQKKAIGSHLNTLQSLQSRLRTALEVTPIVTQIGSDHDKATMFCALASTMKQACAIEPKAIRQSLGEIGFKPNEELVQNLSRFGLLVIDWNFVLVKTFGQGQFQNARCAVFNVTGDIAVTDDNRDGKITVFGYSDEKVKLNIITADVIRGIYEPSCPWGLVVGKDGRYFVTDKGSYVKVFNAEGRFQRHFTTIIPNGHGLAIDCNGRVIVGSRDNCIFIHCQDGSSHGSFAVQIVPYFIAVSSADHIIVSDHASCAVHAYDNTGNHLHKFAYPEGMTTWCPTGICCVRKPPQAQDKEEVYVACKSPAAIYRYSVSGKYLGVLTKDVKEPWGISIKIVGYDDAELLVVDQKTIRVFKLKK